MKKGVVIAVLFFLGMTLCARGDDINDLKQMMAEQNKKLQEMQEKLGQLEKKQNQQPSQQQEQKLQEVQDKLVQLENQQNQQDKQIEEKVTKTVEEKKSSWLPDSLKWAENIKFSGDFRYRFESINSETKGKENAAQTRNRIRARLGLDAKIGEDWNVGFRLATGSDSDPASTNQTLSDGFAKKAVWIDLAYANWHPKSISGLDVYGGKMPNPFYRVGDNQVVWDSDVNPEGIAGKYVKKLSDADSLYINGGGFWLKSDEGGGSNGSAGLWAIQSYWKHEFESKNYLLGGLSYYMFGDVDGKKVLFNSAKTYGNTTHKVGNDNFYVMNYNVLEGFAEYGYKICNLPSKVYGSYYKNTAATTSKDTAWIIGTTFNKAKDPGSWELGYDYRSVQADATVGSLTDSDFIGGGTNAKGHEFSGKYQLTKNIQLALTYIMSQRLSDTSSYNKGDNYKRLMADIVFKF